MEKILADNFYENVQWFNDFFKDLKSFFDKVNTLIRNELGYSENWYYYYKYNDQPSIPKLYYLAMKGENKLGVQIVFIFNRELVSNKLIDMSEPIIFVTLHEWKGNNPWITDAILKNEYIENVRKENDIISGKIFGGANESKEEANFHSFQVPLDCFLEYKEQTAKEKIINKIKEINMTHNLGMNF